MEDQPPLDCNIDCVAKVAHGNGAHGKVSLALCDMPAVRTRKTSKQAPTCLEPLSKKRKCNDEKFEKVKKKGKAKAKAKAKAQERSTRKKVAKIHDDDSDEGGEDTSDDNKIVGAPQQGAATVIDKEDGSGASQVADDMKDGEGDRAGSNEVADDVDDDAKKGQTTDGSVDEGGESKEEDEDMQDHMSTTGESKHKAKAKAKAKAGKAKAQAAEKSSNRRDQSKNRKFWEIFNELPGDLQAHAKGLSRSDQTTFIHSGVERSGHKLMVNTAAMIKLKVEREEQQKGSEKMVGYILEDIFEDKRP